MCFLGSLWQELQILDAKSTNRGACVYLENENDCLLMTAVNESVILEHNRSFGDVDLSA